MKYQLVVELKINNKVEKVSLSSGTLEGLLKYTTYCNNTCELIKFLPHDEDFSAREYIEKYLNKKNDKDYKLKCNNDAFILKYSYDMDDKKIFIIKKLGIYNREYKTWANANSIISSDMTTSKSLTTIKLFIKTIH